MISALSELRSKKGLTLIEILLALIIFVILAGGVFYVFATARGWAAKTQRRLWGNTLAQDTIEWLKNTVTANPTPGADGLDFIKYHDRDPATGAGPTKYALYGVPMGSPPFIHQDPLPAGHPLGAFPGTTRSYTVEVLNPTQVQASIVFPDTLLRDPAPGTIDYQMRRVRVTVTWTEPTP